MIHTPTIKAAKFWPGSLGRHATHAVVFARMIVGKKDFGPLPFMVPIRSRVDHKPYDGIKVGDIGTKMGYNTVDNGYLKFDHYRVPRGALLNRFVSLSKEGEFELLGDPRAARALWRPDTLCVDASFRTTKTQKPNDDSSTTRPICSYLVPTSQTL